MPRVRASKRGVAGRVVIVCACLLAARAAAQQAAGTARLSGTVVSSATPPQPVRGAVVTLNGVGANGRSAVTDDQGRFAFVGLPAGRFTITAMKPAWLTSAYGAKAPGRPGTAVVLATDQAITRLTLVLPHGAAIGGTVRDVNGEAASLMPVTVTRVDTPATPTDPLTPDAVTDDRGAYRVYGLAPGTYVVAASPRSLSSYTQITVPSAAEMDAAFREQQARANGAPLPTATAAAAPKPQLRSYAPTYFPGTPVSADATRVTVETGEDKAGVDFSIALIPVATVEGRVVSATGPLPEISVTLMSDAPPMRGVLGAGPSSSIWTGVNGNDTFRLVNVAPGHYTLVARTANMQTTVTSTGAMQGRRSVDPGTVSQQWASTEIDVHGDDVIGLTLQLQPALSFNGRVAFNGSAPAPQNLALARVTLKSENASASLIDRMVELGLASPADSRSVSAAVRPDGTFQLDGLLPGRFYVSAPAPAGGWWLQSAIVGSRDVIDTGFDLSASAPDVVLTFSDRHSEISGVLQAGAGQPAPDYVVVVFPANPSLRSAARRLQSTRPATDGRFTFADLPAGEYILAALSDDDGWQAPAVLEPLASSGVKITVADGAKIVQNLKIGGLTPRDTAGRGR